jgi:tetratricopeptide (TPR) repeat protein
MKNVCLLAIIVIFSIITLFPQNRGEERAPVVADTETRRGGDRQGSATDERINREEENRKKDENKKEFPPPSDPIVQPEPNIHGDARVYYTQRVLVYTSIKEEGIGAMEDKNYYRAILLFTEALSGNRQDLELYFLRGTAELHYGLYEQAIKDFTYYLRFFDDDAEAYFIRGLAYFYYGDKDSAKADFLTAKEYSHNKAGEILRKYY